ncbi:MAG: hypothetical protein DDT38_01329 [Firmicutes bacterium]|nr:hypothetical protein [candidate division NPL-UPA2 bacterium]
MPSRFLNERVNKSAEDGLARAEASADLLEQRRTRRYSRYRMNDAEQVEELLAAEGDSLDTYLQHLRTVRNPRTRCTLERLIRQKIALEEQLVKLGGQETGGSLDTKMRDVLLGAGLAILVMSLLPQLRESLQQAAMGLTGAGIAGTAGGARHAKATGWLDSDAFQQLKEQLEAELSTPSSQPNGR